MSISPMAPGAQPMNPYDHLTLMYLDIIEKHGWAIVGVLPEAGYPPFSYTIGLSALGHPELIIYGLDHATSATPLNALGGQVRAGRTFRPHDADGVREEVVSGKLTALLPLADLDDLVFARHIYAGQIEALQVVWSDRGGFFPWERGYELAPDIQPVKGMISR